MKKININTNKVKNLQFRSGGATKVASSDRDFRAGMSVGNQSTMVFPFRNGGPKNMTMTPDGYPALKEPLMYEGYTNGRLTDRGVAVPNKDFTVNGDTVVERRLPKAQYGRDLNGPAIPLAPGFMGQNIVDDSAINPNIITNPTTSYDWGNYNVLDATTAPDKLKPRGVYEPGNTDFYPATLSKINPKFEQTPALTRDERMQAKSEIRDANKKNGAASFLTAGDILRTAPINATYNLGKYLFTKPTVEQAHYNPYASTSLGIMKNMRAVTDLNPIRLQDTAAKQGINDNVSSASGRIANLLQQDVNTSDLYRKDAIDKMERNNNYAATYANALYNEGTARQVEDRRVRDVNMEHKAKHDDYLGTAVQEYTNDTRTLGETLNNNRQASVNLNALNSKYPGMFQTDRDGNVTFTGAGKKYWSQQGVNDPQEAQIKLMEKEKADALKVSENANNKPATIIKLPSESMPTEAAADKNAIYEKPDGSQWIYAPRPQTNGTMEYNLERYTGTQKAAGGYVGSNKLRKYLGLIN